MGPGRKLWNPNQYLKFGSARLKPAVDLLSRATVMCSEPSKVRRVIDLGCGPGNCTELLLKAFPSASYVGLDSSKDMIDSAVTANLDFKQASFRVGEIEAEAQKAAPADPYDIIFCNSALHWCADHHTLLPQLTRQLNPNGGILAIQMPETALQTSHVLMETAAFRSGKLAEIQTVRIPRAEQTAPWYYKILSPLMREVEVWSAEYLMQMPMPATSYSDTKGLAHPVLDFTRATGLLPIIEALGGEDTADCQNYLNEYDRLLYEAYPAVKLNNKYVSDRYISLFTFKRMFIVCKM
ncbi:S-adenosyl-L-methionine-dependent methyltransferase [Ochromonadaceae sp. CCMP2298]|nr:S-adenosyl-L-methionine-dependent methyltransferase [Ochromonadaceae sp. CCMP2298]|mmetsp:Transcript_27896/g.61776  ORF Transcript_27896/g.61776 Transcript_27896/m.61776 type:complete len:295 (-) Transcript_27896:119-1003(-)